MTSVSTRFFGHPRETKWMVFWGAGTAARKVWGPLLRVKAGGVDAKRPCAGSCVFAHQTGCADDFAMSGRL
jgi:hypothetical protein